MIEASYLDDHAMVNISSLATLYSIYTPQYTQFTTAMQSLYHIKCSPVEPELWDVEDGWGRGGWKRGGMLV